MFVSVHDEDGKAQSKDVGQETGVEVGPGILLQTNIKTEQQRNEDSRDDNVSQAEHGEVAGTQPLLQEVLGEHQLDWRLERLGNRHHDVGAKDPEDVIDEQ